MGFTSVADGGRGFFAYPISWSIGVALGLFLLFANGFGKVKFHSKNKVIGVINKAGFVPAVIVAGVIGMVIGELDIPDMAGITSFWFNPLPGLQWVWQNFHYGHLACPRQIFLLRAPAHGHHLLRHCLRRYRRRHGLPGGHQALPPGRGKSTSTPTAPTSAARASGT